MMILIKQTCIIMKSNSKVALILWLKLILITRQNSSLMLNQQMMIEVMSKMRRDIALGINCGL